MKLLFTFCLTLMASLNITAQVNVKLVELSDSEEQNCFSIEITNTGNDDVQLWGQNYRLYYNAAHVELNEESLVSNLPTNSYTDAVLKQHMHNMDAGGFGVLPFEGNLGFINFYIDDKTNVGGQVLLEQDKTMDIAEMCFDGKLMPQDIVWASEESTATYATAFNEMIIYNSKNDESLEKEFINYSVMIDEENISTPTVATIDLDYYPNPFTDRLTMDFHQPLTESGTVTVTDLFGSVVQNIKLSVGSTQLVVDGTQLLRGAYIINVQTESGYSKNIKALRVE